jgi:4'-phosphopantetheinyl transferase
MVYYAALADFAEYGAALLARLTPAEQARAHCYARPADRARFVVGRACLRALLAHQLSCSLTAVPLRVSALGKPELVAPASVQFNVTHSGAWVAVAIGSQTVGLDVEKIDPVFDYNAVAAYRFGPVQQAELARQPNPRAAFYVLWTRHESLVKAMGHGLTDGPMATSADNWTVQNFELDGGYAGAVAYPAYWHAKVQFCRLNPTFI